MAPANRCRVCIDESNQYFCHNPATNWTKTITTRTDVGFTENVVPQRSFATPTREREANLLSGERCDSHVTGHSLARR
jgi:hypothetical protein